MTKTVKDAAGLLEIIAGHDEKDPASIDKSSENYLEQITGDVTNLVIGVNEDYFFNRIDSTIEKSVRASIQALVEQGAKVKEVKIPSLKDAE